MMWLRAYLVVARSSPSLHAPAVEQLVLTLGAEACAQGLKVQILVAFQGFVNATRTDARAAELMLVVSPFLLGQLYDSSRLPDPSLCVELVKTWVLFFTQVAPDNQTAMLTILVPIFVAITPTAR